MRRIHTLGALTLVLAALGSLAAAPALAAPEPALVDCTTHNNLTRHYTVGQLQRALASMSADVKEYTSCGDVIQRALDAELGGLHAAGGAGSGGGSFLPVPLIIVLVVILLAGAGWGALRLRRRHRAEAGEDGPPSPVEGR